MLGKPIPGETPIDDLSGLKIKGISLRQQLSPYEAANILKATEKYFVGRLNRRKAPFTYAWALRLHAEMFGDVWTWAGTLRQCNLNLGVPAQHIETQLFELMARLPYWHDHPWLTQAAMLHHEAVHIHPFLNGNGRWSRMLANIWLRLHKQPFTEWPEQVVGEESPIRQEYLAAIHAADEGDYGPLMELHQRYTRSS